MREFMWAMDADDFKKAEMLFGKPTQSDKKPIIGSFWETSKQKMSEWLSKPESPVRAAKENASKTSDVDYIKGLDDMVKEAPILFNAAEDSMKELYGVLRTKISQLLKVLVPRVQFLQEESLRSQLHNEQDAEAKRARNESRQLLFSEMAKIGSPEDEPYVAELYYNSSPDALSYRYQ